MDFVSIVGSIASVGSIPLAIYLFIRSKEHSRDKVKREVVRILSNQVRDNRALSIVEIQSVINTKSRDSKIGISSIETQEVIEDLVTEIISNPLINNEQKDFYLKNLNQISAKTEIYSIVEELATNKELKSLPEQEKQKYLEKEVREVVDKSSQIEKEFSQKKIPKSRVSSIFGFIALTTTIIVVSILPEIIGGELIDFLQQKFGSEYKQIVILGFIIASFSLVIALSTDVMLLRKKK